MTDNPYAIPVEDLVATARVPRSEQVEVQPLPDGAHDDWAPGLYPYGDGAGEDVDGD
jgi:hypothetical protein